MSTSFTDAFKIYKRKCPVPDLSSVVNPQDPKFNELLRSVRVDSQSTDAGDFGLRPPETWQVQELLAHPGLLIVQNPFTALGQRYWIARCLRDFPKHPNRTNLLTQKLPESVRRDFWALLSTEEEESVRKKLKTCLRWSTLGYHHDWERKVYSEEEKHPFPADLHALTGILGQILSFPGFRAQAAIVNFYPQGSTLAGHTDHSEVDLEAPLFSISFGQEAVFLIGGTSKDSPATALLLHSGDIVIMSKQSRLCFHAVPKILLNGRESWNSGDFPAGVTQRPEIDADLWLKCNQMDFWRPFNHYLSDCRINLNIRQVLAADATTL
ncbi:nucleic acid dioxygenase ALKBH1 [Phlebotomus argentipes]|uniref:nucleic acid dioxygenase ALKBH1 n=1 Tax=Phlebotomus argentipes TaxID=94469 RepID=UPI002892D35E|nr:nucleic acid dioxygenase ALKBH1 [Phlebotomus argentipes]